VRFKGRRRCADYVTAVTDNELAFLRDDPEMADLFLAEALDHLGTIEAALLALDERPGDVKLLNDIFRPFHTIKGNAGALAHELTGAFTGEEVSSGGGSVNDLAGEFANMVCGRWLSDVAPQSLFRLAQPVVVPVARPRRAPTGVINGQPIWVDLKVER
jgi:hypothetical protein